MTTATATAPTTQATDANGFEIQTCTRCGGCGRYSYNQMDGDRCYGCGGTGKQYTNRAKAARAKREELQTRPVADVKAGEFVWYDPYPMGGKAGWTRILAIRSDDLNADRMTFDTKRCHIGVYTAGTVRSVRDEAHRLETLAAALAYQATLTKTGKPGKTK